MSMERWLELKSSCKNCFYFILNKCLFSLTPKPYCKLFLPDSRLFEECRAKYGYKYCAECKFASSPVKCQLWFSWEERKRRVKILSSERRKKKEEILSPVSEGPCTVCGIRPAQKYSQCYKCYYSPKKLCPKCEKPLLREQYSIHILQCRGLLAGQD